MLQSDDEGIGEVLNNNGSSDSRKSWCSRIFEASQVEIPKRKRVRGPVKSLHTPRDENNWQLQYKNKGTEKRNW